MNPKLNLPIKRPAVKGLQSSKFMKPYLNVYVRAYGLRTPKDTRIVRAIQPAKYDLVTRGLLKYQALKSAKLSSIIFVFLVFYYTFPYV